MSFDETMRSFTDLAENLEKQQKKHMKKQAQSLSKIIKQKIKTRVKKKTGNLLKSVKAGKVYKFEGNESCRVYSSAPHAHLIEYGHRMLNKNGQSTKLDRVEGKYIFRDGKKEYEKTFKEETNKFIQDVVEKSGL